VDGVCDSAVPDLRPRRVVTCHAAEAAGRAADPRLPALAAEVAPFEVSAVAAEAAEFRVWSFRQSCRCHRDGDARACVSTSCARRRPRRPAVERSSTTDPPGGQVGPEDARGDSAACVSDHLCWHHFRHHSQPLLHRTGIASTARARSGGRVSASRGRSRNTDSASTLPGRCAGTSCR